MIDVSKNFIKDGNKNRLRERDLHQIVDVFTKAETHPGYSEDIRDIGGHLHGGIPSLAVLAGIGLDGFWPRSRRVVARLPAQGSRS
jgi:hypothetical protein